MNFRFVARQLGLLLIVLGAAMLLLTGLESLIWSEVEADQAGSRALLAAVALRGCSAGCCGCWVGPASSIAWADAMRCCWWR